MQKLFSTNIHDISNISKISHVHKDESIDYNLLDASTSTAIECENEAFSTIQQPLPVQQSTGFSYSPIIRCLMPKIEEMFEQKMLPFMTMIEAQKTMVEEQKIPIK